MCKIAIFFVLGKGGGDNFQTGNQETEKKCG